MRAKWAVAALFTLPTIGAGYMAWLLWRANEDGRWLFMVFTAFFLILSASPFVPMSWRQTKEKEVVNTRFAGAWVLPFYLLVFGGLLILVVVVGLFNHHGK